MNQVKYQEWLQRKNQERKMRSVLSKESVYKNDLAEYSRKQSEYYYDNLMNLSQIDLSQTDL